MGLAKKHFMSAPSKGDTVAAAVLTIRFLRGAVPRLIQ